MPDIRLLVVSTSTIHGTPYLQYILPEVASFFPPGGNIVFIPYARPSGINYDDYTTKVRNAFGSIGLQVKGVHEFENAHAAIQNADGVFTGGGNTFVLLNELYRQHLIEPLREKIISGMPYMGTSAGSNITGLTIGTTNDMPIVYPPTFEALRLLPFNLNPHYLDPDPDSTHMGETRKTRINEFHRFNEQPVLGLREGSWLEVKGNNAILKGAFSARWFAAGQSPVELEPGHLLHL